MADIDSQVHITGADFGNDLPQWATETTAVAMAKAMSELVELSEKQQRDIVKTLKENGKATSEVASAISEGKKGLGKDLDDIASKALNSASGLKKLGDELPSLRKQIQEMPKSLKVGLAGFGMLAAGVGHAIGIIKETAATLKDMNDSGIVVEGGIRELQHSLAQTGMTLDQLQGITEKYSQVVGTNGWKAITNLTDSVNAADGGFRKYGITTAEATEFTAEYLEQQRMAGVFGAASQRNQSMALQENIERLTSYSKTLNVSRKAMMESTTALMGREDVQARFALMSVEERAAAQKAFAATMQGFSSLGPAGEKFGTLLTDMIANPVAENAEAFGMIASASPRLATAMADMSRRVEAGEKITQEEIMTMLEMAGANKELLANMKLAGGELGAMADSILVASLARENAEKNEAQLREKYIKETGDTALEGYKEWKATSSEAVQGVTGVEDALNNLHATIQEQVVVAFMDLVGDAGGEGVRGLISGIDKLTNIIGMFDDTGWVTNFREFFGEGIPGAIKAITALSAAILLGPSALIHGPGLLITAFKKLGTVVASETAGTLTKFGAQALRVTGGLAAAGAAGYAFGSGVNNLAKLWGGRQLSTTILDKFTDFNDYNPNSTSLTPDQQKVVEEARKRRAENAAKESASKGAAATTSSTGTPTQTTPAAPTMSDADIAKLDKADQQLAYLKKISRSMENMGGLMA